MPAPYPDQRRKALDALAALFANSANTRVIHYSCESLSDREDGRSARVTSIAVRRLDSAQTASFSIHGTAEKQGVDLSDIDAEYDELERRMLDDFVSYLNSSGEVNFLHWNMRDSNYGFAAISHRYQVLGGAPIVIAENRKFDLSRLLLDIYGTDYIGHPRLEKLVEKNGITKLGFLSGKQEADLFLKKDYVALHQSTLRKVDILSDLAERAFRRTLKTNSNWWVQNGGSVRGMWNWLVENKSIAFILTIIGMLIGWVLRH